MMIRLVLILALLGVAWSRVAEAQFATVGAGLLVSKRPSVAVAELHAETPPLRSARAYMTLSWTDESAKPTVISAAEARILTTKRTMTGLGAGLLWLDVNDYRPYPILVSTTVVPLPIPRTAVVAIASTQPFQDFEWSLVMKVGVSFWFVR
ncbi:MAG TPA: hypothetical protein VKD28_13945 [Gemmatimonadales bacterium]|nr:hypothetical protein [Gemmatimonadales bacterium]